MRAEQLEKLVKLLEDDPNRCLTLSIADLRELADDCRNLRNGIGPPPDTSSPSELADLTVADIAAEMGKSERSVRGLMNQIPEAYKFAGKEWRCPSAAWRRFMRNHKGKPKPQPRLRGPLTAAERDQMRKAA